MKTSAFVTVIGLALAGLTSAAWAQEADLESPAGLLLGGAVSTDDRVSTQADPQLTFEAYRLELITDASPTEAAKFHAEAWVRSAGLSPSSLARRA